MSNDERARVLPVLATLLLAALAFALSQTMVVPALPAIAQEYGTSRGGAAWVLTGFLLSASVATPIVGKLGDVLGKGRVLTGVLLAFSAGSVVSGLADALGPLVAGRVLQGVAGGVFPLAFGIIRDTFPPARVGVGIGVLSAMFAGDARPAGRRAGHPRGLGAPRAGPDEPLVDIRLLSTRAVAATNRHLLLAGRHGQPHRPGGPPGRCRHRHRHQHHRAHRGRGLRLGGDHRDASRLS